MFCRECGNPLSDGSKFCDKCGTPVTETAQPQAQYQPQYQPQPQVQYQPQPQVQYQPQPQVQYQPQPQAQYQPQPQAQYQPQPQAQYQPQPQVQYQPQQPAPRKKFPVVPVVIAAVLVVALVVVGVVMLLAGSKAPMSELFEGEDWSYGHITLFDGTYVIRSVTVPDADGAEEIWNSLTDLKVKELEEGDQDEILEARNVDLFLMDEEAEHSVYMVVTEEGLMYVNYNEDDTRYFSDCQEIYTALCGFLPEGDETSLEACIPDGNWNTVLITFYGPDGTEYDSAYIADEAYAQSFVDRLQGYTAKFGGGTYGDFEGYEAVVSIFGEDDAMLFMVVYEDGSADLPMGDWTCGFYDAVDIYDMLWEELCVINGYY